MDYKISKISNGLRVLTVPVSSFESITATVWVMAGSADEDQKLSGMAHFLEHMAFKGGEKYKTAKEISELVDGMGAENNAGTSKEWTNFWIKTQSTNLDRALDVLSDITLKTALEQKEIDKERNVIYEELAMYEDTPMMSIGEYFEENIYKGSPLERKIGGDKTTLKNVNRPEFLDFRNKHYRSDRMLISVAGGINEKDTLSLVEKHFSSVSGSDPEINGQDEMPKVLSQGRTLRSAGDRVTLKTKKSDQAHLIFGFPAEGKRYQGKFAQGVLATILGMGMSSRLFTEVREKRGLAYSVRAGFDRYIHTGCFTVYAGVTLNKIDESIEVIKDQIYGLSSRKYPVSAKELEKAKNMLIGRIALSLESSGELGDFFAEQIISGTVILTPKEFFRKVSSVKIEDVYFEAEKVFAESKSYLSIVGPYKDKQRFEKLV